MVDVDWHICCARANNSDYRHDKLGRTRKCDAHEVPRTNPPRLKNPRKRVRAHEKLAVGHPSLAIDNCGGFVANPRNILKAVSQQS